MFVKFVSARLVPVLAAAALSLSSFAVQAADMAGSVEISKSWARPSIGQVKNSAAFFVLKNTGSADDRLIDARSDLSKRTEIHTHLNEDGVMRMRQLKDGVAVPAGQEVLFKPHGLHIMFIGLHNKLEVGQTFPLTLVFEKGGEVEITVEVTPLRKKMGAMNHGDMKHGNGHGAMHGKNKDCMKHHKNMNHQQMMKDCKKQ